MHLFPGGGEGALFLYDVLMVGSITYVHRPVSYTHLDVYKRQDSHTSSPVYYQEGTTDSSFLFGNGTAVSYTHLDVYKRQVLYWSP